MTRSLVFTAYGTPAPQGSKRHVGGGRMVESSKHVGPWRDTVTAAAREALDDQPPFPRGQALVVRVEFHMPRPAGHYGTGRNATTVKPTAPSRPITKPDVDKLLRAVCDALTDSGVIHDDAQVVALIGVKTYTDHYPRAHVVIREHTD